MTPAEITNKLSQIRTLPALELLGWWQHFRDFRAPFEGEIAALQTRARQLNVTLPS